MIRRFASVDSTIDGLGGTNAVGVLTSRDKRTVSAWRTRGFPPEMVFLISEAAAELEPPHVVPAEFFGVIDPRKANGLPAWRKRRAEFARISRRKNKGIA